MCKMMHNISVSNGTAGYNVLVYLHDSVVSRAHVSAREISAPALSFIKTFFFSLPRPKGGREFAPHPVWSLRAVS